LNWNGAARTSYRLRIALRADSLCWRGLLIAAFAARPQPLTPHVAQASHFDFR
jgi:hypothetical protein